MKGFLAFVLPAIVALVLGGCAAMSGAAGQQADFVARNGNFWTVDEENPKAEAVAALNGRFIFVGSNAGVDKHIGEDTKVIDLDGAFVTPGFYDNHVHFESTGQLPKERPARQTGEVCAEAVVLADSEGDVPVRLAVDPKLVGGLEDRCVAVGRWVEEAQGVSCADLLAVELDVAS